MSVDRICDVKISPVIDLIGLFCVQYWREGCGHVADARRAKAIERAQFSARSRERARVDRSIESDRTTARTRVVDDDASARTSVGRTKGSRAS